MLTKLLKFHEHHGATSTHILAIDMNPGTLPHRTLMLEMGYPCDGRPNIAITHAAAMGGRFSNDPDFWGEEQGWKQIHEYIIDHWDLLRDGDDVVVDFEVSSPPMETETTSMANKTKREVYNPAKNTSPPQPSTPEEVTVGKSTNPEQPPLIAGNTLQSSPPQPTQTGSGNTSSPSSPSGNEDQDAFGDISSAEPIRTEGLSDENESDDDSDEEVEEDDSDEDDENAGAEEGKFKE